MIDLEIDDSGSSRIAHITLNAPQKLNALDEAALRELDAAYAEAEASGVRALVLRGEGRACTARAVGDDQRHDLHAA